MHHVLVTGGAGYVGSHACRALAGAGYVPVTLDDLSTGHRRAVKWGPLEIGNIADPRCVNAVIVKYRPAAVMHFAALSLVGESGTDPARYYSNNVAGTLSLLQSMRDGCVSRLVFSSSCATYGQPDHYPIGEDTRQEPISAYGRSKLMVETILGDFSSAYGLRSVALRYFNAAGAADADGIGEAHETETHLIPLVIGAALGHRGPVEIFGTDYPTADGTCERDYVHVSDLADAHVRALSFLDGAGGFHAFNLGTGHPHSVRSIISGVSAIAGRPVPLRVGPRRPGDPARLFADPRLAARRLGWSARTSTLEEILSSAWRWHSANQPEVRLAV